MSERYDEIGEGYALMRRPDPRIASRIHRSLGDARTVLNVGAGAGSYEPTELHVVAVEPSVVMAAQRPPNSPPAVLATAEMLPFADDCVDAVMAVMTVHHWNDVRAGLREAVRVARRRVVILTIDPLVEAQMWLFRDYIPEVAARDREEFPAIEQLLECLGPNVSSEVVPVPHDCSDGFLLSFWSRPERVLTPAARNATSGFARLDDHTETTAVARLAGDLSSGAWDQKFGGLRQLAEYDAGLRLIMVDC